MKNKSTKAASSSSIETDAIVEPAALSVACTKALSLWLNAAVAEHKAESALSLAKEHTGNSFANLGKALHAQFKGDLSYKESVSLSILAAQRKAKSGKSEATLKSERSRLLAIAFPKASKEVQEAALAALNAKDKSAKSSRVPSGQGKDRPFNVHDYTSAMSGNLKLTKRREWLPTSKASASNKGATKTPLQVFKDGLAKLGNEKTFAKAVPPEVLAIAIAEWCRAAGYDLASVAKEMASALS